MLPPTVFKTVALSLSAIPPNNGGERSPRQTITTGDLPAKLPVLFQPAAKSRPGLAYPQLSRGSTHTSPRLSVPWHERFNSNVACAQQAVLGSGGRTRTCDHGINSANKSCCKRQSKTHLYVLCRLSYAAHKIACFELTGKQWYARSDSNRHCTGFEPASSADWVYARKPFIRS